MELKLVISISLGLLFIVINASPTPTLQVKCINETFFDNVAMTKYSCTICSTREGSQFYQCKSICKCTVINSAVSQLSTARMPPTKTTTAEMPTTKATTARMPPTMVTTSEMPTTKATTVRMPPTLATKARTSSGTATQGTMNLTFPPPALVTSTNGLMVIIIVLSAALLLLSLAIFCFRRRNRQEHIQGCFRCIAKKPIPCSEKESSPADPGGQEDVSSKEPHHVTGQPPTG